MDILLLVIIAVAVGIIIYLLVNQNKPQEDKGAQEKMVAVMERLNVLAEQNHQLRQALDSKLSEANRVSQDQIGKTADFMHSISRQTQKAMGDIHSQSQKIISQVTEKLTKLDETNKQVVNFSAQLQNLQDILKNPKQRGVLGEYFLEETLKNVLPPKSYQMQYKFKDNSIVDAVVFVKDKIIPVDSKFSLENYERILNTQNAEDKEYLENQFKQDLKKRIDETSKYIKPEEGTMDFAFMFIPSEAIYYDLLINKVGTVKVNTRDLVEYAFQDKKVIIVSPTSFLAYLQTVLQGLRALQIEESAKSIQSGVAKLRKHVIVYDEYMLKMGKSMSTTVGHYNRAYKELGKIDNDISKITEGDKEITPEIIEKPALD